MKDINKTGLKTIVLASAALCVFLFSACEREWIFQEKTKPPVAVFMGLDTAGQAKFIFILSVNIYANIYALEKGIVYGQSPNVTLENGAAVRALYMNGVFEVNFPTIPNTSYYWRSYVRDSLGGVLYGEEYMFSTFE